MDPRIEELEAAARNFKACYTGDTDTYRAAKSRLWSAIEAIDNPNPFEKPAAPPPDDEEWEPVNPVQEGLFPDP